MIVVEPQVPSIRLILFCEVVVWLLSTRIHYLVEDHSTNLIQLNPYL